MKMLILGGLVSVAMLLAAGARADDARAMAEKKGCFGCHALDHIIVGPAWKNVAAKYRGNPEAEKKLLQSIMTGSGGQWGDKVHMQAQKQLTAAEAGMLVRYILSLSD